MAKGKKGTLEDLAKVTLEDLQKSVDEATTAKTAAENAHTENSNDETAVALSTAIKVLEDAEAALQKFNDAAQAKANEEAAAKAPKSKSGLSVVKVGDVWMEFNTPVFMLNHKTITHEEAAAKPQIIEQLVAIGFGGWVTVK
jgi:hypothetical protein